MYPWPKIRSYSRLWHYECWGWHPLTQMIVMYVQTLIANSFSMKLNPKRRKMYATY
jgi:hypothetical protein